VLAHCRGLAATAHSMGARHSMGASKSLALRISLLSAPRRHFSRRAQISNRALGIGAGIALTTAFASDCAARCIPATSAPESAAPEAAPGEAAPGAAAPGAAPGAAADLRVAVARALQTRQTPDLSSILLAVANANGRPSSLPKKFWPLVITEKVNNMTRSHNLVVASCGHFGNALSPGKCKRPLGCVLKICDPDSMLSLLADPATSRETLEKLASGPPFELDPGALECGCCADDVFTFDGMTGACCSGGAACSGDVGRKKQTAAEKNALWSSVIGTVSARLPAHARPYRA
jgi:hypothetical protein